MTTKNSRNDLMTDDQNLINGIQKHQSTLPSQLTFGSQTMAPSDVVTLLQGRITTGKAVIQADNARTAAVAADRAKRSQTQPQVSAFKRLIIAMYLESPDVLGDYGLAAPKPPQMSAQERAAAAAKAAATRKALGTKGTQQKKAAKAALEAAPAASAPSGAPSAQPAAPAAQASAPAAAPAAPANKGS